MLKNYIKVSLRNLARNKAYSIINILGLAVGMAITVLIGIWVYDELSCNTNHQNYRHIAQLYQHYTVNNEVKTIPVGSIPMGEELKTTYKNDFERVVLSWWVSSHALSVEDKKIARNGTFMEASALEMFSFEMVKGSWTSLKDPASVVLSESTAKALFGDVDPMDKVLRIDNTMDVKVTGIFREFPHHSRFHSLHFISTWDILVASNGWMKAAENSWGNSGIIFVEIKSNKSFEEISKKIEDIRLIKLEKAHAEKENPAVFLHPMNRWNLYSEWKNGVESGGKIQFVWLFGIIGIFVLILACINFINLSTAQSERRAREVGIRKSVGSARRQLIYQFLAESFSTVVFAFFVALALVAVALPWLNDFSNKNMKVLPGLVRLSLRY